MYRRAEKIWGPWSFVTGLNTGAYPKPKPRGKWEDVHLWTDKRGSLHLAPHVPLPMICAAVVTLTALRTGVPLARAMTRFLHGGRASIKLRQQYSACPHIQHEWLRLACRRSAAVHDADRHDYGDGDGLNEREAEAAFRQVRADDASAEWRVGRVTVCDRRAAFGLHELQATVLGLHANRPARCVGVGQQCIASRRVS